MWEHAFLHKWLSLLFLQALQSAATSLPSPRSGNPGYIVGKPLLALTGDISHSVSFLGLSGLLQTNEKSCSCWSFGFPNPAVPHFLGIQDFLYQAINIVYSQMVIRPKALKHLRLAEGEDRDWFLFNEVFICWCVLKHFWKNTISVCFLIPRRRKQIVTWTIPWY